MQGSRMAIEGLTDSSQYTLRWCILPTQPVPQKLNTWWTQARP